MDKAELEQERQRALEETRAALAQLSGGDDEPDPVRLPEQVIRAGEAEPEPVQLPEQVITPGPPAAAREGALNRTPPGAPPAFQRDTEREALLNAMTARGGASAPSADELARFRSDVSGLDRGRAPAPGPSRVDPAVIRRVIDRPRTVEGPGSLGVPAPGVPARAPAAAQAASDAGPSEADLYQRALDARQRNRTRNLILGLIGAIVGKARPQDIQALNANNDAPIADYEQGRRIREASRARSAQESRESAQLTRQERQDQLERERMALGERRADLDERRFAADDARRTRLDDANIALREAQLANITGDVESEAEMRDPTSAASLQAQEFLRQAAPRLGLTVGDDIGSLSAEQIEDIYGVRVGHNRVRRSAIGRGGAGGGGASATSLRDAYVAGQVARGVSEEDARRAAGVLDPRTLRSEVARSARPASREDATGEELLPGVRTPMELGRGEGPAIRRAFADARNQYAALGRIEEIGRRFGPGTLVNPDARAAISAELPRLRAMVTQIQNTGVISPTEMESINSTLPNPSDLQQMTFGEVNTRLRSFRSQLEAGVSSGLLAAGVDDAGRAAAIRMLRSGSTGGGQRRAAPAQPAQGGDTVTVRAPSGEERRVPRARARNLPSGWRVVE